MAMIEITTKCPIHGWYAITCFRCYLKWAQENEAMNKDKFGDLLLTDDVTPDQQSEYQRLLASPTSTARALIEARAEIERLKGEREDIEYHYRVLSDQSLQITASLDAALNVNRAAESQIAALRVDLAAMMKERDEARIISKEQQRSGFETVAQLLEAEKARDAAHVELSQARAERDMAQALYEATHEQTGRIGRERDEARGEIERLRDSCLQHVHVDVHASAKALLGRAVAAARPIVDYYNKLAKWDGGCALPPKPTQGQRIDFVNAFSDATATAAVDAYRAQQEVIEAAKWFKGSGVPHERWVRLWNALDELEKVETRRGGGR